METKLNWKSLSIITALTSTAKVYQPTFEHAVNAVQLSVGHVRQNDRTVVARPWNLPRNAAPFAGLACSLNDLMKFARFMLGDGRNAQGERLLSEQGMAALLHPNERRRTGAGWD
ncbi:hypothetical protein [Deinococcus yavapaiensis]|uniref:hypothetical protein n=1 Tax=Deinococcus yavapaiensis TaxID=309889 RepID=UPI000DA1CC49|nr:hypothetical protein [Deinococcus yavapaiensis]